MEQAVSTILEELALPNKYSSEIIYSVHTLNIKNKTISFICYDVAIEFGYESTEWVVQTPYPILLKYRIITWNTLESLNILDQQEAIQNSAIKTIESRKRQYQKCQFCHQKVSKEHRFDKDTCHVCASQHFGVIY